MAEMHPFRGWRYDLGRVGAIANVIAPPYDVIDEGLSRKLHEQHPHNVIRLILDPILPSDTEDNNRYTRSAQRLRAWMKEGVLTQERVPAVYVYFQSFDWEGQTFERRGVMARVRQEKFGEGRIYPHEETLSGPKADRLKLFHSTGMNLSQIFGLYPDEDNEVADGLEKAVRGMPPIEATDHLGVRHRLWVVTDPKVIVELQSAMGPRPLFIADGHHRYETGLRYREDRMAAGVHQGDNDPSNFILMMLVGMSDPGLRVMPTHRLVSGLGDLTSEKLSGRLKDHFELTPMGAGREAGRATWKKILDAGRQESLGFCTPVDGQWILATLKSPSLMDTVVRDHSSIWKSLGVSILHRLALDHCLSAVDKAKYQYVHLTSEVEDAVSARSCDLACLVQPATVDHIRELAGTFEKMPAKSTYFYPKLASGLVFNPIAP